MGIFDIFRKKPKNRPLWLYTEEELDEYESYVEACLGSYEQVFHEIASPDIHLDVIPIPPAEEAPYIRLVTMGAGACTMNLPESLRDSDSECAEYMILLPADWNINSPDDKDYWPMHILKSTARLPIHADTWLGYGHTVSSDEENTPYAENTQLCSVMLVNGMDQYGREMKLKLSSGRTVHFYQLVPLYREELAYKQENGADALLDLLHKIPDYDIVSIRRKNAVTDRSTTEETADEKH